LRYRTLILFFLAPVILLGCPTSPVAPAPSGDAAPPPVDADCPVGVIGDTTKPVEFDFRILHVDGSDAPLADGEEVPLIFPPQGGRVIFVGVRATNLDGCGVQLTGALRDTSSQQVRIDSRTVNLIPTGDGWGTSAPPSQSISAARDTYSNVPVCPNEWATVDIYDHVFQLEVTIEDREKRKLTKSIKVLPRCAEPDKVGECLCICQAGYVLGQACPYLDGGTDQ
jgi:hypothetical protein